MAEQYEITKDTARRRLRAIAKAHESDDPGLAAQLRDIADRLRNRPQVKPRGKIASKHYDRPLRKKIRQYVEENPDEPQHVIGTMFGVNQGRVNNALRRPLK